MDKTNRKMCNELLNTNEDCSIHGWINLFSYKVRSSWIEIDYWLFRVEIGKRIIGQRKKLFLKNASFLKKNNYSIKKFPYSA